MFIKNLTSREVRVGAEEGNMFVFAPEEQKEIANEDYEGLKKEFDALILSNDLFTPKLIPLIIYKVGDVNPFERHGVASHTHLGPDDIDSDGHLKIIEPVLEPSPEPPKEEFPRYYRRNPDED